MGFVKADQDHKPNQEGPKPENGSGRNQEITKEQLWENIRENSDLGEVEIHREARAIKEMMRADSNPESFFSDKAALIQAARNLGMTIDELYDQETPGPPELEIQNIVPEMRSVNLVAEIKEYYVNHSTDEDANWDRRLDLYLTDGTGTIKATLWDEEVDVVEHPEWSEGTEIELEEFESSEFRGDTQLQTPRGSRGQIYLVDEGDALLNSE